MDPLPKKQTAGTARVVDAWRAGIRRAIKTRAALTLAGVAVAGILALLIVLLPIDRNTRAYVFIAGIAVIGIAAIVGTVYKAKSRGVSRSDYLDEAFGGFAEAKARYLFHGRRYHGAYSGRKFDAYCREIRVAQGTVSGGVHAGEHLEIIMDTDLETRFHAGADGGKWTKWAIKKTAPKIVKLSGNDSTPVRAYALDEAWGRQIITHPAAVTVLENLLIADKKFETRALSLLPGMVVLTLRRIPTRALHKENVKKWLNEIKTWLEIIEALPGPAATDILSPLETHLRGDRARFSQLGAWVFGGIVLGIIGICLVTVW